MRHSHVIATVIAAALVLSGCASLVPADSSPTPKPAVTASPSAEPEQQRETGMTRPAMVFDGKCDQVFTDAELAAVMGEPLPLTVNHFTELWGGGGVISQAGGVMCNWTGTKARVIAIALPQAALNETLVERECAVEDQHDAFRARCLLEQSSNGILLSAEISADVDDAATVSAQREALRAIFVERAAEQDPADVPLPALGSWQLPPDCVAVVDGADLSAVPGLESGVVGGPGGGYGKNGPQAEFAIAGDWSPPSCSIQAGSIWFEFVPIGGYRWHEQEVAARPDATPLSIPGVDAAYTVPYWNGSTLVYAFSGPNMLMFTVNFTKNAAGIATALIASLDETAVS